MNGFSRFVLESTLELASEAMPPEQDPRVIECVKVIRGYLELSAESPKSNYEKELRPVITTLLDIALQHRQFLIAARLQEIARQLGERAAKSDVA